MFSEPIKYEYFWAKWKWHYQMYPNEDHPTQLIMKTTYENGKYDYFVPGDDGICSDHDFIILGQIEEPQFMKGINWLTLENNI